MPDLPLVSGTLADPTCWPADPQTLYDEMFAKGSATMPSITGILIQDAAPDPIYRGNKGWLPTSGGVPIYPGYIFIWHATVGHWVSRNPIGATDGSRRIYTGTAASVNTYDGGEVAPVGIAAGPMWEIDTAFDGRTPVGVGTIPTSAPAATITNALDTTDSLGNAGAYKVALTAAEGAVADHVHPLGLFNAGGGGNADDAFFNWVTPAVATANWTGKYITGGDGVITAAQTTADIYTLQAANGAGVVATGHNNMQPWIGVYFLKRTAREFYRLG